MNNVLEFVLFPLLGAHDICASAQVCKEWLSAARRFIAKSIFVPRILFYYAITGQYDAYVRYGEITPYHITQAIKWGQTDFVLRCNIPEITFDTRLSADSCNLCNYLIACVESSRDELFTTLYLRGGWNWARIILPVAAKQGSLVACRQLMYGCDNDTIAKAILRADYNAKHHIVQLLLRKCPEPPVSKYDKKWMDRILAESAGVDYKSDCDVPDDTSLDLFG